MLFTYELYADICLLHPVSPIEKSTASFGLNDLCLHYGELGFIFERVL